MFGNIGVTVILILCFSNLNCVWGWTNEEFEMFDLVEELGTVSFYEFLGVSKEATTKEIKSAYRQLSVKFHPDKNPDDPNAPIKFRQLVGVYESLKDDDLRKAYHDVLEFGLPNWRQPVFYFRRARKLAIWQVGILLLIIVTTGQYLAAWGSYFEQKLSLNEMVESQLRKKQRSKRAQKEGPKVEEVQAELEEQYLQKPSVFNTAPFQLMRLGKYLIVQFPFDIVKLVNHYQEEREKEQQRVLREKLEEEERNIPPEPKKPRKRKTFKIPEKELGDEDDAEFTKSSTSIEVKSTSTQETFITGGLWTDDDITQLIHLCSKYPGGFPDRWNQISQIMRRPVGEVTHMAKKVMEELTKKQADGEDEEDAPVKTKVKTKGKFDDAEMLQKVLLWSKDEQKRLEAALQMYSKSTLGDRWAKIASHVGKSKEECMQRYKHVADLVKKKKEQEQVVECENTQSATTTPLSTPAANTKSHDEPNNTTDIAIDEAVLRDNVVRQNSSSSNGSSGSDHEWCIVDSQKN